MSGAPDLPASGMLHVQVAEDCTLDGGTWHLTTDQHGAPTATDQPSGRRNGPIENVHAGRYVGYGLNERRVLPKAEKSIIRHAQNGLFSGLKAADYLKYDGAWPPPAERVLPFMHGLIGPRGWSCTELSRVVELPLRDGDLDRP